MKTQLVKIIFSVTVLLVMTGITVNAQEIRLRGDIPFDFKVGNAGLKAGRYDVDKIIHMTAPVFVVQDQDYKNRIMRFAMPVIRRDRVKETVLIFNRYRDNGGEVSTFLSQIWVAGNTTGFEFNKHQAERDAEKRAARRDIITIVFRVIDNSAE